MKRQSGRGSPGSLQGVRRNGCRTTPLTGASGPGLQVRRYISKEGGVGNVVRVKGGGGVGLGGNRPVFGHDLGRLVSGGVGREGLDHGGGGAEREEERKGS